MLKLVTISFGINSELELCAVVFVIINTAYALVHLTMGLSLGYPDTII